MRVVIDLLIADKKPEWMLFAAHALGRRGWRELIKKRNYIIITGRHVAIPKTWQAHANIRIYAVKLFPGVVSDSHQLLLPKILQRLQPDVLHVPASVAPIGWHGPLVITVHDLGFLKVPEQTSPMFASTGIKCYARVCDGHDTSLPFLNKHVMSWLLIGWYKPEQISHHS